MSIILFIHGALGSKNQFEKIENSLDNKFETYSINLSGHGGNTFKNEFNIENFSLEIIEWMDKSSLDKINIFGYSMGGYIGLWLMRYFPERIDKLFTYGTKLKWNKEEVLLQTKFLNPEITELKVPEYSMQLKNVHGKENWKNVMLNTEKFLWSLATNHLEIEDFQMIKNDVLLTLGSLDKMVTFEETKYVQNTLINSKVKVFENQPHQFENVNFELLKSEIELFF